VTRHANPERDHGIYPLEPAGPPVEAQPRGRRDVRRARPVAGHSDQRFVKDGKNVDRHHPVGPGSGRASRSNGGRVPEASF